MSVYITPNIILTRLLKDNCLKRPFLVCLHQVRAEELKRTNCLNGITELICDILIKKYTYDQKYLLETRRK